MRSLSQLMSNKMPNFTRKKITHLLKFDALKIVALFKCQCHQLPQTEVSLSLSSVSRRFVKANVCYWSHGNKDTSNQLQVRIIPKVSSGLVNIDNMIVISFYCIIRIDNMLLTSLMKESEGSGSSLSLPASAATYSTRDLLSLTFKQVKTPKTEPIKVTHGTQSL